MSRVTIDIDTARWAAESLANHAIETQSAYEALCAIRMYDAIVKAGGSSAVKHVLSDLAELAHVDL